MGIISAKVLDSLPFSEEPFSHWSRQTDLLAFLCDILDNDYTIIREDGVTLTGNSKDLGPKYFEEGQKNITMWMQLFVDSAARAFPKPENLPDPQLVDFENDPVFGKASKYYIAWERMVCKALEDDLFFSIAHVLETEFDIKCCFQLAGSLYYKQALQVLRGYLESLVLPIYFCEYPDQFDQWKANNYRVPAMRGKQGILKDLADKQVIATDLAAEISRIYDSLNSYIHGSERKLISRGIFTGNYMGHVFKENDFREWCIYLAEAADVGIRLLAVHFDQWKAKAGGRIICSVCHGADFDMSPEMGFSGEEHYNYKCLHCGEEMTLKSK